MEIELNTSRLASVPPPSTPPRVREPAPAHDEASFSGAQALTEALARLPDTRPEVVQRSREVVGSVKYPPDETLNRIAKLLAMNLSQRAE